MHLMLVIKKEFLPDVHLTIKAVDPEKPDPKPYILTVKDNGPGIECKTCSISIWNCSLWFKIWIKTSKRNVWFGCNNGNFMVKLLPTNQLCKKLYTDGQTQEEYEIVIRYSKK